MGIKYLNDNEDEFPLYKAWKESNATASESTNATDDACERFPELYCGCEGSCSCSNSNNKAIIRF